MVGWIKRGPSGVIGTNKKDALDTVTAILEDVSRGPRLRAAGRGDGRGRRRDGRRASADAVSFGGWQAIDEAEVGRGEPHGRPRIKFVSVEEMLEAAKAESKA